MNKRVSGQRDRMRICLIAPVPPFRGGIAKYCYSLAKELEKRHELLLLSYKRQYPQILYGRKSQVDQDIDKEEVLKEFKRITFGIDSVNIGSWVTAARSIAGFKPDAVILPWWVAYWTPMYWYLLHSLKKRNIRVIFICINIFEHEDNAVKKFLTKYILRRVNDFIVHSEQEKTKLLEINNKATVKKHLLPLFEYESGEVFKRDQKLHLLFFGFVRPYKGLDTLLNAVGILRDCDISLEIAGEFWEDKDDYLRLVKELGITDKVTIVDKYVPDSEMSHYFSRADLVVLPYRKTVTSGVIATAYGFRKPVLATDIGGFSEVIRDEYTGKVVPPDDPRAFAEGILWFLANKQIDFTANISTFTAQKMSWQSLVDVIEEFNGS
jgi:glycosyltransferase involved in cell wall biosynthesis